MGCRCNERKQSLRRAVVNAGNGQVRSAMNELARSAQSFAQDARSAQTRREMLTKLRTRR